MKFEQNEVKFRTCEICGERKGGPLPSDHTECSRLLQEMHKDDMRKARPKKLSKVQTQYLGKYFNEHG